MNSLTKSVNANSAPRPIGNVRFSLIECACNQTLLERIEQAYLAGDLMQIGILLKDQIDTEIDNERGGVK
jgi:hypothetical protein